MAIQKYTAQRKIEVVPAGAKAFPEAMSREAGAMAGFGQTVMGSAISIGKELLERDADVEYSTARRQGRELFNGFARELETTIDPKDYEKPYKNFLKGVEGLRPKSRRGGERFDEWFDYMKPGWDDATSGYVERQILRKLDTDSMLNIEAAIESGDRDGAQESINNRVASRLWTVKQGQAALDVLDSQIQYHQAFGEIRRRALPLTGQDKDPLYLRDAAANISGEMVIKAIDWNKYPHLTRKQEELLIRDADALAKSVKQRAAETLDLIQEKTDVDFFGLYSKGTLMPDDIESAVDSGHLDRASGDRWKDRLANPRDFPTNPAIEADLLRRIEDPTELVTKKDILALMGKGLSTDDTRRFLTNVDTFKDPWFVRADRFLKDNLGWSDTLAKYTFPEGALSYKLAMDELFDAIETEKLKGRDILNRAAEISVPYIIEYHQNVLLTSPERIERIRKLLGGKAGVEPKSKPSKTETENSLDEIWK